MDKMSIGIGIIIKACIVFKEGTLFSLYNSLILPYVSYSIHAWCRTYRCTVVTPVCWQLSYCSLGLSCIIIDSFCSGLNILSVRQIFVYTISIFINSKINQFVLLDHSKRHMSCVLHNFKFNMVITDIIKIHCCPDHGF